MLRHHLRHLHAMQRYPSLRSSRPRALLSRYGALRTLFRIPSISMGLCRCIPYLDRSRRLSQRPSRQRPHLYHTFRCTRSQHEGEPRPPHQHRKQAYRVKNLTTSHFCISSQRIKNCCKINSLQRFYYLLLYSIFSLHRLPYLQICHNISLASFPPNSTYPALLLAPLPDCCRLVVCQGSRLESTEPPLRKLSVKWFFAMIPTLRGRLICTSLCTFLANSAKILSIFCAFAINFTIKIWRFKDKSLSLHQMIKTMEAVGSRANFVSRIVGSIPTVFII